MKTIHKLLVPTDFSPEADSALGFAASIARQCGAVIRLMHLATKDEDNQQALQQELNAYQDLYPEIDLQPVLLQRASPEPLAEFILQEEASLLVMGSKGAGGFKELFQGSNAEKIIRQATMPVITVKGQNPPVNVKDILFASNFLHINQTSIDSLKLMMHLFDAKVHFLKVITTRAIPAVEKTAEAEIEAFANHYGFANYTVNTRFGHAVEDCILEASQQIGADMIAMTTHGRNVFAHLLLGSIAEKVANHSDRLVLTFNQG